MSKDKIYYLFNVHLVGAGLSDDMFHRVGVISHERSDARDQVVNEYGAEIDVPYTVGKAPVFAFAFDDEVHIQPLDAEDPADRRKACWASDRSDAIVLGLIGKEKWNFPWEASDASVEDLIQMVLFRRDLNKEETLSTIRHRFGDDMAPFDRLMLPIFFFFAVSKLVKNKVIVMEATGKLRLSMFPKPKT